MADLIPIDDPNDPRVAAYRDIKERDLVGRRGCSSPRARRCCGTFVRDAPERVRSPADRRQAAPAKLGEVFADLPESAPVYVAGQAVLDAIAGFHLHRGVLAVGEKPAPLSAQALLARAGPRAVVLVLMGIANHDNLGGIFRNAAAFGVDGVILDGDCCDPFYRKAIQVSIGATLGVPDRLVGAGRGRCRPAGAPRFPGLGPEPTAGETLARLDPAGPGGGAAGGRGAGAVPGGHGPRAHRRHPDGQRLRLAERGHDQRDRAAPSAVRESLISKE